MADPDGDPVADPRTGSRDQRLILEGWFASHADSGVPGPHVAIRTSDGQRAVLATSRVPEIVADLTEVGARIDRAWALDGAEFTRDVIANSEDPDDPEVIRRRRVAQLEFYERLWTQLPKLVAVCAEAEGPFDAVDAVAALLEVSFEQALTVTRLDLCRVIRTARERQAAELRELRRSPG